MFFHILGPEVAVEKPKYEIDLFIFLLLKKENSCQEKKTLSASALYCPFRPRRFGYCGQGQLSLL